MCIKHVKHVYLNMQTLNYCVQLQQVLFNNSGGDELHDVRVKYLGYT